MRRINDSVRIKVRSGTAIRLERGPRRGILPKVEARIGAVKSWAEMLIPRDKKRSLRVLGRFLNLRYGRAERIPNVARYES